MSQFKALPSQEELHQLFDYSIITGALYWKSDPTRRAGSGSPGCYRQVQKNGARFYEHRLIYKWVTGEDPEDLFVDHCNGIKDCNGWHNLRLASNSQNQQNRKGVSGVYWNELRQKWYSQITVDGKVRYVGIFKSKQEAVKARKRAAAQFFGDYAFGRSHYTN